MSFVVGHFFNIVKYPTGKLKYIISGLLDFILVAILSCTYQ